MSEIVKLYAPIIDNILPAAVLNKNAEGSFYLSFSFKLNRAVSLTDYDKIFYEIREVTSNDLIRHDCIDYTNVSSDDRTRFGLNLKSGGRFEVGKFLKIQIAFGKGSVAGYYSEVGIFKCVKDMEFSVTSTRELISIIPSNVDQLEKIASYKLSILSTSNVIEESTNWIIHSNESNKIEWYIEKLLLNSKYKLKVEYITTNNIINSQNIDINFQDITRRQIEKYQYSIDSDNGWIEFKNIGLTNETYYVYRSDDEGQTYYKLHSSFKISSTNPTGYFRDYNIEYGKQYKYLLFVHWNSVRLDFKYEAKKGQWKEIPSIIADFENIYLYDKDKQLKLSYNPKISAIKPTILEQKTNTIGGKYPIIFRNGNVNYYEFPISALLSRITDSDYSFIDLSEVYFNNLTFDNFNLEQQYKQEVLAWLTNGRPKVFKSPVEGNHIVRLMNVSLAPNDTVGRMLHTLSATAIEINDYCLSNLSEQNLNIGRVSTIPIQEPTRQVRKRSK